MGEMDVSGELWEATFAAAILNPEPDSAGTGEELETAAVIASTNL